jgi:hypothetical protein
MECGLKKLRAPSAIRMRACSTIQNTQRNEDRFILIGVSSTTRSLVDSHRNFLPPSWLLSRLHVNTIESVVFGDYRDRIEGLNLAA